MKGICEKHTCVVCDRFDNKVNYLDERKKRFGRRMRELLPYKPDETAANSLCLAGQDLFQWARETSMFGEEQENAQEGEEANDSESQLPEGVEDQDGDGRVDNVEDVNVFDHDGDGDYDGPIVDGPAFEVALVDAAGALLQRSSSFDEKPTPIRVLLRATKGETAIGHVLFVNTGSTALFYRWAREQAPEAHKGGALLHKLYGSCPLQCCCFLYFTVFCVCLL